MSGEFTPQPGGNSIDAEVVAGPLDRSPIQARIVYENPDEALVLGPLKPEEITSAAARRVLGRSSSGEVV